MTNTHRTVSVELGVQRGHPKLRTSGLVSTVIHWSLGKRLLDPVKEMLSPEGRFYMKGEMRGSSNRGKRKSCLQGA